MLSERRKLYENQPPEGAKAARGGSKMVSGRPPDGSFVPVGPNLAAKAARKPCLGALGALLGRLRRSWNRLGGFLGPAWRLDRCFELPRGRLVPFWWPSKKEPKIVFWMPLGIGFLKDVGGFWEASWEGKSSQDRLKIDPKRHPKHFSRRRK